MGGPRSQAIFRMLFVVFGTIISVLAVADANLLPRESTAVKLRKTQMSCKGDKDCPKGMFCPQRRSLNPSTCEKVVAVSGIGGKCGEESPLCKHGLTCKKDVCVRIVLKGSSCSSPFTECKEGLRCYGMSGQERCVVFSPLGGMCDMKNIVCQEGLYCIVASHQGRCYGKFGQGERCDEKYAFCKEGHICGLSEDSNSAKRCFRQVAFGESCLSSTTVCESGLRCIPVKSDSLCMGILGFKAPCRHPWVRCRKGYSCDAYDDGKAVCKRLVGKGSSCSDRFVKCMPGFSCTAFGEASKCA